MHYKSHGRSLLILSFLTVAFLLLPDLVVACVQPPRQTVLEAYDKSEIVIIARAITVEKQADPLQGELLGTLVSSTTMEVERVFKGNLRVGDKIEFGQGNGIRCTWVFYDDTIGEEFLLYLDSPPEGELWYEFGLSRSKALEYAAEDLLYLNNMDRVRGRTRISGVLDENGLEGLSIEGQNIRIIGKSRTYTARTDKNGVYELYDLPPGKYVLEPELKFGWKVDEFHLTRPFTRFEMMHGRRPSNRVAFTLRPRKHFGVDIKLKLSNHLSGTIYDANSKPMPSVCVSLVRANHEKLFGCQSFTNKLGRFQIESVEAGDYLIVLNHEGKVTLEMPFPKLYYPGVTDRTQAKTISVKHGESVDNLLVVIKR